MGLGRFVSLNNALIIAAGELGEEWMGESPLYENWAKFAVKKIESKTSLAYVIKEYELQNKCQARICSDLFSVITILPGKHKKTCELSFHNVLNNANYLNIPEFQPGNTEFTTGSYFVNSLMPPDVPCTIKYIVRDGQIQLRQHLSDSHITVFGKGFKRAENGQIMIAETDVEAVSAYIISRIVARSRHGKQESRYTASDVNYFNNEWILACRNARAEGSRMSSSREAEYDSFFSSFGLGNYTNPE